MNRMTQSEAAKAGHAYIAVVDGAVIAAGTTKAELESNESVAEALAEGAEVELMRLENGLNGRSFYRIAMWADIAIIVIGGAL